MKKVGIATGIHVALISLLKLNYFLFESQLRDTYNVDQFKQKIETTPLLISMMERMAHFGATSSLNIGREGWFCYFLFCSDQTGSFLT